LPCAGAAAETLGDAAARRSAQDAGLCHILAQDANTVLAKDFIGLTVYAPDKTKIGTISDLILSKDAKVRRRLCGRRRGSSVSARRASP